MQTSKYEKNNEYLKIEIFYYFANLHKSFSSVFQLRKYKLTFKWNRSLATTWFLERWKAIIVHYNRTVSGRGLQQTGLSTIKQFSTGTHRGKISSVPKNWATFGIYSFSSFQFPHHPSTLYDNKEIICRWYHIRARCNF